jgi:hypothetical protein
MVTGTCSPDTGRTVSKVPDWLLTRLDEQMEQNVVYVYIELMALQQVHTAAYTELSAFVPYLTCIACKTCNWDAAYPQLIRGCSSTMEFKAAASSKL